MVIGAYALRQRQRRSWTEGVLKGTASAAKFVNNIFEVQWGGDDDTPEDVSPKQLTVGLAHPEKNDVHPILMMDSGHPNFSECLSLKKGDRVLITFNPDGWRWGDITSNQDNWTKHVLVQKQE